MSVSLLEDIERGSSGKRSVSIHPTGETVLFSELWSRSGGIAAHLAGSGDTGEVVAAILTTSMDALATVPAVWRAGMHLASLPHPSRGMSAENYRTQVADLCAEVGARRILVDPALAGMLEGLGLVIESYDSCAASTRSGPTGAWSDRQLIQFSSGTTGTPKAIQVACSSVAANVRATTEALSPTDSDSTCSWLPLSHDAGLVGVLLNAWAGAGYAGLTGGSLHLIPPEHFLLRPALWFETCSSLGITHTAAPTFGFRIGAKVLARARGLDLGPIRVCIAGAEAVDANTLREFLAVAERFGFSSQAISPCYGLAEATAAVTLVRPDEHWTSATFDVPGSGLASGAASSVEVVGSGRTLDCVEIRVVDGSDGGVGELQVRGTALMDGYVGQPVLGEGSWLATGDLAALVDDQLFVLGRHDDIIIIAGRNFSAPDLERAAESHPAIRSGNSAALVDAAGRLVIVGEQATGGAEGQGTLLAELSKLLVGRFGVAPARVILIEPGSLSKTPSGKLARHRIRAALLQESLAVVGSDG